MYRLIAMTALLLFAVGASAQETILIGAYEKCVPFERVGKGGEPELWFAVQFYDDKLKHYVWMLCITRDPELFDRVAALKEKTQDEPFSQLVRVFGREMNKPYRHFRRMIVKRVDWLQWIRKR